MVAVQIRDVPEEIRDQLAADARARGVSLQTYLRDALEDLARAHRQRAWLDEVAARRSEPGADSPSATEIVRKGREEGW